MLIKRIFILLKHINTALSLNVCKVIEIITNINHLNTVISVKKITCILMNDSDFNRTNFIINVVLRF